MIFADSNDYSLCVLGQAIFSRIVSHLVWRSLALDTWPQFSTCSCNSPYVKLLNKQFYWTKKGDLRQVDHPKMGPRCYQFVCKAHFFVTTGWQKINEFNFIIMMVNSIAKYLRITITFLHHVEKPYINLLPSFTFM